jgi:ribokinase
MSFLEKLSDLQVTVVGSYNTDLVIWCDAIPAKGQSLVGGEFDMYSGGRGANCAVAAARAGCQVKFVGAHGRDIFGKMAVERLTHERIDIRHFIELPSSKTGVALMFQERGSGTHAALVATSANNQFSADLVTKAEPDIRKSSLIFAQFEIGSSALSELFRVCERHRKRLVVHAAPVDRSTHFAGGHYFLLVADDFDAQLLTSQGDMYAAIRELHRRGVQNVIIKHKDEALIFSDGTGYHVHEIPSVRFMQEAGVVECLTAWAGISLEITGDLACAAYVGAEAMAFSLSRYGAQDSLPYRSELSVDWPKPSARKHQTSTAKRE